MKKIKNSKGTKRRNVGIITHYYNSHNYGGLLQSYALCMFLKKNGINAEQICYLPYDKKACDLKKVGVSHKLTGYVYQLISFMLPKNFFRFLWKYINREKLDERQRGLKDRRKKFKKFEKKIPHSKVVYYQNTIELSNRDYEFFITGSDQVWNPTWFNEAYFLVFADKTKHKLSYAASIGKTSLSEEQKLFFRDALACYNFISVREKNSVKLLKEILPNHSVEWVVDPTLLLEQDDWEKIVSKKIIKEKYIFCYFFGEDIDARNLAKSFAKENGLKIVTLPHLLDHRFTCSDLNYADYELYNISPQEFISLVKYAECVFTNSFHACVPSRTRSRQN